MDIFGIVPQGYSNTSGLLKSNPYPNEHISPEYNTANHVRKANYSWKYIHIFHPPEKAIIEEYCPVISYNKEDPHFPTGQVSFQPQNSYSIDRTVIFENSLADKL